MLTLFTHYRGGGGVIDTMWVNTIDPNIPQEKPVWHRQRGRAETQCATGALTFKNVGASFANKEEGGGGLGIDKPGKVFASIQSTRKKFLMKTHRANGDESEGGAKIA